MLPYVSQSLWKKCQLRIYQWKESERHGWGSTPAKGLSVTLHMKTMSVVEANVPGNVCARQ